MWKRSLWRVCLGVALVPAAVARADVNSDAAVLMDPHAGSMDKMAAVGRLARMGDAARPAAFALARQSHYDLAEIRIAAMDALVHLVGSGEARRLRNLAADNDGPATPRWLADVNNWRDVGAIDLAARYGTPAVQRAATMAALRAWTMTRQPPTEDEGFRATTRRDLAAILSAAGPRLSSENLRDAIALARAMHTEGPEIVPLLLVALADADPQARAAAAPVADQLFTVDLERADRRAFHQVVAGVVQVLCLPKLSKDVEAVAAARLKAMGDRARPVAATYALAQRLRGNARADEWLRAWSGNDTALARAVAALAGAPMAVRDPAAGLIDMIATDPRDAHGRAVELLTDDDDRVRMAVAPLLAAAGTAWVDRNAVLYACVAQGVALRPEILQALDPDPAIVNRDMAQLLRNLGGVRVAALRTLEHVGLHGSDARLALEPLLEDEDETVRTTAATLLNRADVLARERVPAILKELRSDDIARRIIAARELDELGVQPQIVTAALRRAVESRDMPAREGLIAAVERAYASRVDTLAVLSDTAKAGADATSRAYARAALREIGGAQ